jgi:hypothetical protein
MPDVYQSEGLSGLGSIGIIRSGQPTQYQPVQQGLGGGGDLVDSAIVGRQQWEARRAQLIGQLPYANRREAGGIHAELQAMQFDEHERQAQARERRIMAHQSAEESAQLAKQDRETDIDEHGAALMQALPHLRGLLRNGHISKDEYDSSVLDAVEKYGALGMHHPGAAQLVNHYLEEADKQNAFQQRRSVSEATKLAGRYGIEPQIDPETGLPSVEHTRMAALQTPKGRVEMLTSLNQEMKQKYGLGTGVSSLFNPVAPHSSPDNGKTIDIPYLETKTGKIGKANIPTPLFDQMKADFSDRYFATVPQQQAPATTAQPAADPRTELAQRALNDPNASEAHKSAAKKILGIQENAQ